MAETRLKFKLYKFLIKHSPEYIKERCTPKGEESEDIIVSKNVSYGFHGLCLTASSKLKPLVNPLEPKSFLPGLSYVAFNLQKYSKLLAEDFEFGPCIDVGIAIPIVTSESKHLLYLWKLYNDSQDVVEVANREWKWPKEYADIQWRVDENTHSISVKKDDKLIISFSGKAASNYRASHETYAALTRWRGEYYSSSLLYKARKAKTQLKVTIPASSPISHLPISSDLINETIISNSKMDVTRPKSIKP